MDGNASTRRTVRLVAYTDAPISGGAEQSLATLLSRLDARFEVTVVGTAKPVLERIAAVRPGTRLSVLASVHDKRDVRPILAHVRAFRRLRPDVCHLNLRTPYSCQYGLLGALLAPGTKVVAVEHLPLHSDSRARRTLRRLLCRGLSAHVAVGVRAARMIEDELGLPAGSVLTIHNGVSEELPEPFARRDGFVVGSLGRLDAQKGYDVLLRVLARLPGASAVLVGDGPDRAHLEALARDLGVADRLTIVGWSDEARRYLATFDVFALPSRFEGFPLSIVEAMLAGVPVVATDVGSVGEAVVDGETGLLVPAEDEGELLVALASLQGDAERRRRLGESGRAIAASRFTAAAMAEAYERLYDRVLG